MPERRQSCVSVYETSLLGSPLEKRAEIKIYTCNLLNKRFDLSCTDGRLEALPSFELVIALSINDISDVH
jgi:hypothetical protein